MTKPIDIRTKWERRLKRLGLSPLRGYNSRRLIYGFNGGVGSIGQKEFPVIELHVCHHAICAECGREFYPKRSDAKTCSSRCRIKRYRRVTLICV